MSLLTYEAAVFGIIWVFGYLPISHSSIQLSKPLLSLKYSEQVRRARQWVSIGFAHLIYAAMLILQVPSFLGENDGVAAHSDCDRLMTPRASILSHCRFCSSSCCYELHSPLITVEGEGSVCNSFQIYFFPLYFQLFFSLEIIQEEIHFFRLFRDHQCRGPRRLYLCT